MLFLISQLNKVRGKKKHNLVATRQSTQEKQESLEINKKLDSLKTQILKKIKIAEGGINNDNFNPNDELNWDQVILKENWQEQPDVVNKFLGILSNSKIDETKFQWTKVINKNLDSAEFNLTEFQLGQPKYFSIQKIQKDMEIVYGIQQNRSLRPAEEAIVIGTIYKLLQEIELKPEDLLVSVNGMVQRILKRCDLENLSSHPICLKQVECHWKICATVFRCSGKQIFYEKRYDKVLTSALAKNHFLNLNNENSIMVNYLLQNADIKNKQDINDAKSKIKN